VEMAKYGDGYNLAIAETINKAEIIRRKIQLKFSFFIRFLIFDKNTPY
jgi:hypothetical protein